MSIYPDVQHKARGIEYYNLDTTKDLPHLRKLWP